LFDTNALSEPIRPLPDAAFMKKFRAHRLQVAISATTWNEALFGLHRLPNGKRKDMIAEFLFDVVAKSIPVLPYDAAAAEWHAAERARLQAKGCVTPFADGQIAAVAKVNDLVVVTKNVADFQPFEGIDVLGWWGG
jgi:tRNA(fMet)-specific endonuclease VapC